MKALIKDAGRFLKVAGPYFLGCIFVAAVVAMVWIFVTSALGTGLSLEIALAVLLGIQGGAAIAAGVTFFVWWRRGRP